MSLAAALAARWASHVAALPGPAALKAEIGEALLDAYGAPERRYHGLAHLDFLFREADRHAARIIDPLFVAFAIWFHDAIYQPTRSDNEERSAQWAETALSALGLAAERVAAIAALIRQTARHAEGEAGPDAALFLDMDIAILGAPRPVYDAYVAATREEYAFAPDAAWRAGRGAFLRAWLDRPRLFRTEVYEAELAAAARANMAAERAALEAS